MDIAGTKRRKSFRPDPGTKRRKSFRLDLGAKRRKSFRLFDELNAEYEALKKVYSAVREESKAARGELKEISDKAAVAAEYIKRLGDTLMGIGDVGIDPRHIPSCDHVLYGLFDGIAGLKHRIDINKSREYASDSPFSSPGSRGHRRADSNGSSVGSFEISHFDDRGDMEKSR